MKSPEDATVAVRAGAQLIGCIFAPSKRQCSRDEAKAVVRTPARTQSTQARKPRMAYPTTKRLLIHIRTQLLSWLR